MQKLMFNDRYGLTDAVIEGRKTMTRRLINLNSASSDVQVRIFAGYVQIIGRSGNVCAEKKLPYKVGEIVAVAQSYEQVYRQGNMDADDAIIRGLKYDPGMCNKMYIRAALMPHQIRITGIRCEQLQDISDEDCMREGVRQFTPDFPKDFPIHPTHFVVGNILKNTPREAFAALIDRTCGRGTWERNPWVVAYEFELVK